MGVSGWVDTAAQVAIAAFGYTVAHYFGRASKMTEAPCTVGG